MTDKQNTLLEMDKPIANHEHFKKVKQITLKNTLSTYPAYAGPILITYAAKYFGLTSCPYNYLNYLSLMMLATITLFSLIVYLKKKVTIQFSQIIGIAQLINWLLLSTVWLAVINEIRVLALFSSLVVYIFFFSVGNFLSSLLIVGTFQTSYLVVSYYCITYLGQANGHPYLSSKNRQLECGKGCQGFEQP
ncbi:MAG: hypothetical protein R6T89_03540 [Candidatus Syntrophosphaera sp.]